MLKDIAVLTGGQVITEELGLKLENTEIEQLGRARKVVASKEHTTIVDGHGEKSAIDARVQEIRNELNESSSSFDKEKLQERVARLAGGIGVIKVGAFTETEMKAKKFKIEDALNATRAAVEEGIVAGGGASLARIAPKLEEEIAKGTYFTENEKLGAMIVRRALEAPLRQIAENTGIEPSGIINFVQTSGKNQAGYNFAKFQGGKWEDGQENDMISAGIVDPVKVTRLALENAVSIASTLVTTEAIVVDKPEPKSAEPAAGMGGMGGMGGMY
jgi:chaperonin GroEL